MANRGRPFEPGNKFGKGRPRGSRNKFSVVAQELLSTHAEPVVRKALVMALQGDRAIVRAFLDRIVPIQRSSAVYVGKMPAATIQDLGKLSKRLIEKTTMGELTIPEANGMADLIEKRRRQIETEELERRLRALEAKG